MYEAENMKTLAIEDIEQLKVHGRTAGVQTPLVLFWTGSGIELNAKAGELWIEIEVEYASYEPWISVVINAYPVGRRMLTKGRYWICVFRGMNRDIRKNVRVLKETQAMSGDPACTLLIHAVKCDGELLPVAEKPYKIEFIGDSITSGEGAIGAREEEDWIPMWFSAVDNYAYLTAEALNAEYRIVSQSGWGVLTSWDNNPRCNIPERYEYVCGVLEGEKQAALGAFRENDFSAWQPDIVVVNLGTNDGSALSQKEGVAQAEHLAAFEQAAQRFLAKLRTHNRKAHIVWAYGMLGLLMMPAIGRAVDKYKKQTGDDRVSVFQLPEMKDETVGARNHPGKLAHEQAANALAGHLKAVLESKE